MFLNGIFRSLFCRCAHQRSRFARQIIQSTSVQLQEKTYLARWLQLPVAFLESGEKGRSQHLAGSDASAFVT